MDQPIFGRVAQCDGKKAFTGYGQARRRARILREKTGDPVTPYHCPHCGKYHLGQIADTNRTKAFRVRKRQLKEAA